MQDLCALRRRSHKGIDAYCEHQTWSKDINFGGSWMWGARRSKPVTDQSRTNCHLALDALNTITISYKIIINEDTGYIYTNNLDPFSVFADLPGVAIVDIKQATVDRPRDSIVIKSSVHSQRTYFRNQKLDIDQKPTLRNFLSDRSEIRLSPGLNEWLFKFPSHRYLCDNYFIDHNDDGFLTMLYLVTPLKIKKTYKLLRE